MGHFRARTAEEMRHDEELLAQADWERCVECQDPCVSFGDGLCIMCKMAVAPPVTGDGDVK